MTVQELILELQKYNPSMMVVVNSPAYEPELKVVEDYPLGDDANPKCEYATVLVIE